MPVFGRDRRSHRDGPKNMSRAADCKQNEETKPDAYEGIEDRLDTDPINYVNEEADAKEEGYALEPDERSSRTVGTCGLRLVHEFLQLAKILWPLFA
jgi:hypothetical protein